MSWAEPIAYGPLDLRPRNFERLQPHEFYALLEGYNWRKKDKENLFAYFASWIINTQLKEPIGPDILLKPLRENPEEKKRTDEEYMKERFNKILKKK